MILASSSPRRAELLAEEGYSFDVRPAHIDETRLPEEDPITYVERLALGKARAAHQDDPGITLGQLLIAADTIVWFDDGTVLGKPFDADDARRMLHMLSARTHHVTTAVCLLVDGNPLTGCISETVFSETTDVEFFDLTDQLIEWYISTGEPFDKAGSYGIQGHGKRLVKGINGDYCNVVGLPVARLIRTIDDVQARMSQPSGYWF